MTELGVTGGAVGIVLEGEIVYLGGFGVRDVESKAPVDANTVFRVGSVSKTITALAIMRLRDEGKVVLDAPAATYVPALRSLEPPTRDSPPITVRHLLTMTSGLGYDDLWGAVTFGYDDAQLARFLARGLSFAGAAGERYRYSNLGFALLGKVVENASGKAFGEYIAGNVFGPLGMRSSGFVTSGMPAEQRAVGYYRDGDRLVAEPVPSDGVFAPAGGVYTSLSDFARYAASHLAAYPPRDDAETGVVRRSTLREMHAGQAWARWSEDMPVLGRDPDGSPSLSAMSYGLGWAQNTTCLAEAMVQHGGFEPGYYASIRLLPRQGLGVVVLSTTENLGQLRTFEALVGLLREGGVLEAPPRPASPALVTARDAVIRLLERWDAGLLAETFDPLTQRYSFVRKFREEFARMGRDHGRCRPDGEIVPSGLTQGRFRLVCERGAVEFVVFLTPGVPPVVQMVEWREELPAAETERTMASKLVAALGRDTVLPPELVAASADRSALEKRLARLRGTFGACELAEPPWNDGMGKVTARLRCESAALNLSFRLEPKTSLVVEVSGAQPRSFGAVCAE